MMPSLSEDSYEMLERDHGQSESRTSRHQNADASLTASSVSPQPTSALTQATAKDAAAPEAAPSTVQAVTGSLTNGTSSPGARGAPVDAELLHQDREAASGKVSLLPHRQPVHINVMVYGESGLGKTTCIRNLIGDWKIKHEGAALKAAAAGNSGTSSKTSLQQLRDDPDSLRVELEPVWDDEGPSDKELHFSFQDMPGWGDDINLVNNLQTVVKFLLRQRQLDYVSNRAGRKEYDPAPGAKMTRGITVCLYFLPAHHVKSVDWVMMAAISKLVAVIPVIAKADTYTPQELEDFRTELLQVIRHRRPSPQSQAAANSDASQAAHVDALVDSGRLTKSDSGAVRANMALAEELSLKTYSFKPQDVERLGASADRLPVFTVVGAKDKLTQEQADKFGGEAGDPCRMYAWGPAFPFSRDHSDHIILKQALCGHRNAAIYDLLQDSWARAHTFAKQFEQQLYMKSIKVAAGSERASDPSLLQPLIDEICCAKCGASGELQDKLRTDAEKKLSGDLKAALARPDKLAAELQKEKQEKDRLNSEVAKLTKESLGSFASGMGCSLFFVLVILGLVALIWSSTVSV